MNFSWKKIGLHVLFLIGFVCISVAYFYPVLQDKTIYQSDIVQYRGMAQHQIEYIDKYGEQPYWIDSAFGGMPSYQVGANYPYHFIKQIDRLIRFLPRPADYLFLYFVGLYILFLVLKVRPLIAFLGALAFGFSTYLIVILGVGHNAKAHAIAYMPLVLGGLLLCLKHKYFKGFLLLSIGMAFEISANHFQMTYYLGFLCIVIGIVYLIKALKAKHLAPFFKGVAVALGAVILGISLNSTNILATKEYSEFSTRGKSTVTINPDGNEKVQNSSLEYNYITEYSYGILESFNLLVPRFKGGSNMEKLDTDSETYKELISMGATPSQARSFLDNAPLYWGNQPFVAAPAYIGAGVLFLFVLGLFLIKSRLKQWIVAGSILALILSWGDNFSFLTKLFIDYVPLYDKFRAVSSIQVLIELCVPLFAFVGLTYFYKHKIPYSDKFNALKWSFITIGGLLVAFLILGNGFSFSASSDGYFSQQYGARFVRALKEDRKSVFMADVFRSLGICFVVALLLWLSLKQKLKTNIAILAIGAVCVLDLVFINTNYVNEEDFVSKREMTKPFVSNAADREILKDDSHFRVIDLSANPFNSARASYFHKSIGGYHAAKPKRIQDLFDFHISQGNREMLNMLNIKYIIAENQGEIIAQPNPNHNGNAWFVDTLKVVKDDNEEILALNEIDTKNTATLKENLLPNESGNLKLNFKTDSVSNIELVSYKMNELVYKSSNENDGFAVFSEVYYPYGWQAFIDQKPVPHYQVDYTLRGLMIPSGEHEIRFKFEPKVIQTGSYVSLAGHFILAVFIVIGGWKFYNERKTGHPNS
jgi:hypothetical protein